MTKVFFLVALLVSLSGCEATTPQDNDIAASNASARWWENIFTSKNPMSKPGMTRKVSRGATPELVLRNNQLTYNGEPLALGSSLDAWRQVLGPDTACDADYSEYGIYCWNNLGIWVHASRNQGHRVELLEIFFNQKPDPFSGYGPGTSPADGQSVSPGINSHHNHIFKGYLELDGAGVDARTQVWEVAKLASSDYTYLCVGEVRSCSIGPENRKYSMYFITDDDLEKGLIYEFQMGLLDD